MYRVEVHCDMKIEGMQPGVPVRFICDDIAGDCPGVNARSLSRAGRLAERDALAAGWKQVGDSWVCPGCQKANDAMARDLAAEDRADGHPAT